MVNVVVKVHLAVDDDEPPINCPIIGSSAINVFL